MKLSVKAAAVAVGASCILSVGMFGASAASAQPAHHGAQDNCQYIPKRTKYADIRSGEAAFQLACLILQSQGVPACAENYQDIRTGKACLPQDVQDRLKKQGKKKDDKDKNDDNNNGKGKGGGGGSVIVTLPTIHVFGSSHIPNPKVTVGPVEQVE